MDCIRVLVGIAWHVLLLDMGMGAGRQGLSLVGVVVIEAVVARVRVAIMVVTLISLPVLA